MLTFRIARVNNTLHGRSVHRSVDVPGHNVFRGYTTWANNNHVGVGDGVDLFGLAKTEVYAISDGKVIEHRNDVTKSEVIYIQGSNWIAVYAHIDATVTVGDQVKEGQIVGKLRGDLRDPHLHFDLWVNDESIHDRTPAGLRGKMADILDNLTNTVNKPVVDTHDWAQPSVDYVIAQGLMSKDANGKFRGTDPVTREEIAVILHRLGATRPA
jgi:murein DD-endopeptidase MepM/ murein hydrolase activator NlpD